MPVHAAGAVLYLQIGSDTVGPLAGAAAFAFRKVPRLHGQDVAQQIKLRNH